jgi:hypothetical protein
MQPGVLIRPAFDCIDIIVHLRVYSNVTPVAQMEEATPFRPALHCKKKEELPNSSDFLSIDGSAMLLPDI